MLLPFPFVDFLSQFLPLFLSFSVPPLELRNIQERSQRSTMAQKIPHVSILVFGESHPGERRAPPSAVFSDERRFPFEERVRSVYPFRRVGKMAPPRAAGYRRRFSGL